MGIAKDIIGVILSATITGGLYFGPAITGLVIARLAPIDFVETLVTPPPPVVYFDGAYEISAVEEEGDLDGTLPEEVNEELPVEEEARDGAANGEAEALPKQKQAAKGGQDSLATGKPRPVPKGKRGKGWQVPVSGGKARQKTRVAGKKRKKSRRKCPKSFKGVTKKPNGTYVIARSLFDYHASSIARFNELGWSKDNDKGDKKGWYISGFGCRDVLWHAGFRRGDVVRTVNGKKTNNMLQIFMLYSRFKSKKRFEVKIHRKGRPLTLKYEIKG